MPYECESCKNEPAALLVTPLTGGETLAIGHDCAPVSFAGLLAGATGLDAEDVYKAVGKLIETAKRKQAGSLAPAAKPRRARRPGPAAPPDGDSEVRPQKPAGRRLAAVDAGPGGPLQQEPVTT